MFQNKWKLTAISLALVVVLLASCFVILYKPQAAVAKESVLLDVSIDGPAKITADTPTTYTALVAGAVGTVTYSWSITPEDNNTRVFIDENKFRLTFTTATEEPYLLEVKVYDAAGNFGVASMIVSDPPTYPNYYLQTSTAPYSYMIKADGTGWYYAVDGNTGAVVWSSTNASYVLQRALDALPQSRDYYCTIKLVGIITITNTIILNNFTIIDGNNNCKIISNFSSIFSSCFTTTSFIAGDGSLNTNIIIVGLTIIGQPEQFSTFLKLASKMLTIKDCSLYELSLDVNLGQNILFNNLVFNNTLVLGGFINFENVNSSIVSNCRFIGSYSEQTGINLIAPSSSITIIANTFENMDQGIIISGAGHFIQPEYFINIATPYYFESTYSNITIIDPVNDEWLLNASS